MQRLHKLRNFLGSAYIAVSDQLKAGAYTFGQLIVDTSLGSLYYEVVANFGINITGYITWPLPSTISSTPPAVSTCLICSTYLGVALLLPCQVIPLCLPSATLLVTQDSCCALLFVYSHRIK